MPTRIPTVSEMQQLIEAQRIKFLDDSATIDYTNDKPMQVCSRTGLEDWAVDAIFGCWTINYYRVMRRRAVIPPSAPHTADENELNEGHGCNWHHRTCDYCKRHLCDVCVRKHRWCKSRCKTRCRSK